MKFITLFLVFCCHLGLAQQLDQEGQEFISSFVDAVRAHDQKKVMKHLDKKYRKEQIKFLEGNKEQFINELFAGANEAGTFMTPDFNSIISFSQIDVKEISGEIPTFEVGFEVDIPDYILYSTLLLVRKKKKYVLIGAVG